MGLISADHRASTLVAGVFMAHDLIKTDWNDLSEALPAFLIMVGIPLTCSIADGMGIGPVAYRSSSILPGGAAKCRH